MMLYDITFITNIELMIIQTEVVLRLLMFCLLEKETLQLDKQRETILPGRYIHQYFIYCTWKNLC